MEREKKIRQIEIFAAKIRLESMKEFGHRGFGHVGGALSIADTLATLYEGVMNYDPKNPHMPDRDMLVMSKGHAGPSLYATLALKGFIPMNELLTLNDGGTRLPSHCDKNKTPGIDATTGSLGQGASQACGIALGYKLNKSPGRAFLILGDGECNEGQVWEAAMFASQQKLNNLVVFVDCNGKQLDGRTSEISEPGDLGKKFEQFGFYSQTIDGHSIPEIYDAIKNTEGQTDKPSCIILNTIKGKGVKAVEDIELNHHIVVDAAMAEEAIADLTAKLKELEGGSL